MSPEEQNDAIAEWCGERLFVIHKPIRDPFGYYCEKGRGYTNLEHAWRVTEEVAKKYIGGRADEPDRVIMELAPIHNYLRDLNAVAELEEKLEREHPNLCRDYFDRLNQVINGGGPVGAFRLLHATAAQRAEALLRTLGLWRE